MKTSQPELKNLEAELAAEMRLAFTRATVTFPKSLNTTPIAIAVSHVFADVFYELKHAQRWSIRREFDPLEERVLFQISGLVDRARDEIAMRNVPGEVTAGMSMEESKRARGVVAGLDRNSAVDLLRMIRDNNPMWVQQRSIMLTNRRNMLANQLTTDAVRTAKTYFLSEATSA